MTRASIAALAALVIAACNSATGTRSDILAVTAESDGVLLTNRTDQHVAALALDNRMQPFSVWVLCEGTVASPSDCDAIAPHASRRVLYTKMGSGSKPTEVLIIHRRLLPQGDGYVGGELRYLTLEVR